YLLLMRREFIIALFTPPYAAAVPLFAINISTILLRVFIAGPLLRAFSRFRYFRLRLSLIFLPLSWLSIYSGIKISGTIGAIAAVVLVQVLDTAITLGVISRALTLSFRPGATASWIARISIAAGGAALCGYAFKTMFPDLGNLAGLVGSAVVFGIAYSG